MYHLLHLYRRLGPFDIKNIRRDALLAWMPLLPFIMALALRLLLPTIADQLHTRLGFELEPYYPLLMSSFITLAPGVVGMVIGFLLLDERDEHTLAALQVTPLPLFSYLLYRISLPILLGLISTLLSYALVGLTPLSWDMLTLATFAGSVIAPQSALFLATFAENKVTGLAVMKLLNTVTLLPIFSYFLPMPWQLLCGLIPSYWPLKLFWSIAEGSSYWPIFLIVSMGYNAAVILLLLMCFSRTIQRF
jgi:fluoroquinolone transport system permease protein